MRERKSSLNLTLAVVFLLPLRPMHPAAPSQSTQPLRVLFVMWGFPKVSETFAFAQMTGLIKRGHHVSIHARKHVHDPVHAEVEAFKLLERCTFGPSLPNLSHFDVIFCTFGNTSGIKWNNNKSLLDLKEKGAFRGLLVSGLHGLDWTLVKKRSKKELTRLLKHTDLFMPVNQCFVDELTSKGCPQSKIKLLPTGINMNQLDVTRRKKDEKAVNLLCVGRLIEKKGHRILFHALAQLTSMYPDIMLTIIGDGPEEKTLRSLSSKLGIQKNLNFTGSVTHKEVVQHLAATDIFVLASLTARNGDREGVPVVLKEAMGTGIPVVSTYHSGIPELIKDGERGFLVPESNAEALAKKLKFVIENAETARKVASSGQEHIKRFFDLESLNNSLSYLLINLATRKRPQKSRR